VFLAYNPAIESEQTATGVQINMTENKETNRIFQRPFYLKLMPVSKNQLIIWSNLKKAAADADTAISTLPLDGFHFN